MILSDCFNIQLCFALHTGPVNTLKDFVVHVPTILGSEIESCAVTSETSAYVAVNASPEIFILLASLQRVTIVGGDGRLKRKTDLVQLLNLNKVKALTNFRN